MPGKSSKSKAQVEKDKSSNRSESKLLQSRTEESNNYCSCSNDCGGGGGIENSNTSGVDKTWSRKSKENEQEQQNQHGKEQPDLRQVEEEIRKNARLLEKIFQKTRNNPNDWANCDTIRIETSKSGINSSSGSNSVKITGATASSTPSVYTSAISSKIHSKLSDDGGKPAKCTKESIGRASNTGKEKKSAKGTSKEPRAHHQDKKSK